MILIKKKEFPAVVLEVLHELEEENDPQLADMQKMTVDKNEFKEMWLSVLRAPRREMYCPEKGTFFQPTDKDIVYAFLKSAIVHSREEIPVFYLNKKKKKAEINKIRNAEKKLVAVYTELFAKESAPFIKEIRACISQSVQKIEDADLGRKKVREGKNPATMAEDIYFSNQFMFGKPVIPAIRGAVLALLEHTYADDDRIIDLMKKKYYSDGRPISLEDLAG